MAVMERDKTITLRRGQPFKLSSLLPHELSDMRCQVCRDTITAAQIDKDSFIDTPSLGASLEPHRLSNKGTTRKPVDPVPVGGGAKLGKPEAVWNGCGILELCQA